MDLERVQHWLGQGAQATDRVAAHARGRGRGREGRAQPQEGRARQGARSGQAGREGAAAPRRPPPHRVPPNKPCELHRARPRLDSSAPSPGPSGSAASALKSFCAEPADIAGYAPLVTEDGRVFRDPLRPTRAPSPRADGVASKERPTLWGHPPFARGRGCLRCPDDEFYHADLIGLTVRDTGGTRSAPCAPC